MPPLSADVKRRYNWFRKHARTAAEALELARAERGAYDRGYEYRYTPEEERYSDVYGSPDPGGEWVTVSLYADTGEFLDSIGFIDERDSDYLRVVKAQLAQEAIARENPITHRTALKYAKALTAHEREGVREMKRRNPEPRFLAIGYNLRDNTSGANDSLETDSLDEAKRWAKAVLKKVSFSVNAYVSIRDRETREQWNVAERKGRIVTKKFAFNARRRNPPVRDLPRGYEELDAFLGSKWERKLAHNTTVFRENDVIAVKLHGTVIARFWPTGRVVLNTGGWSTATTKSRMSNVLPLPWNVTSYRGTWWVTYRGVKHRPFVGGTVEFAVQTPPRENPRRRRRTLRSTLPRTRAGQRKRREMLQRKTRRRRMRRNPLVTFGANPNGDRKHVATIGKVVEIGYRRTVEPGKGKLYKHEFEHPMNLTALADGTLAVWHPTIPAWARD